MGLRTSCISYPRGRAPGCFGLLRGDALKVSEKTSGKNNQVPTCRIAGPIAIHGRAKIRSGCYSKRNLTLKSLELLKGCARRCEPAKMAPKTRPLRHRCDKTTSPADLAHESTYPPSSSSLLMPWTPAYLKREVPVLFSLPELEIRHPGAVNVRYNADLFFSCNAEEYSFFFSARMSCSEQGTFHGI